MALTFVLEHLIGREGASTIREMALMPKDLAPVVPDVEAGDRVVVLVHGFCASAGVFRPLAARLEGEADAKIATFTHAPCVGVKRIAHSLKALVDRIPHSARLTIVGHSLGGVVARWYVQEMGGHERVERTISLGSPFGGVAVPRYFVGSDIHGESALLQRLRERAADSGVPHTSVVATEDRVVPGVQTACLGTGDVVILRGRGHNTLLFDEEVAGLVIDRVRWPAERLEAASSGEVPSDGSSGELPSVADVAAE